jgi:hypothetical protein
MDGNQDGLTGTPRTTHSVSPEASGRQESRGGGMAVSEIFGELSSSLTYAVLPIVDSSSMHPFQ